MELKNDFHLAVPIDRAWEVLTDLELIAPCMPGATVTEVKKTAIHGTIEVKAGPLTLAYAGKARILKRDKADHTAILRAEGKEAEGTGRAQADVKAQLSADSAGTAVALTTHVDATGRLAQLGQGILEDIHAMVLGRFVAALESTVLADELIEAPPAPAPEPDVAAAEEGDVSEPAPTAEPAPTVTPEDSQRPVTSADELPAAGEAAEGAGDGTAAGVRSAGDPGRPGAGSSRPTAPAVEVAPTVSRTAPPTAVPSRPAAGGAGRGPARRFAPVLGAVALAWLVRTLVRRRRR